MTIEGVTPGSILIYENHSAKYIFEVRDVDLLANSVTPIRGGIFEVTELFGETTLISVGDYSYSYPFPIRLCKMPGSVLRSKFDNSKTV